MSLSSLLAFLAWIICRTLLVWRIRLPRFIHFGCSSSVASNTSYECSMAKVLLISLSPR